MILPPIVLSLNMHEEEIYKTNQDIFKRLGYEIEEFGGNEYKVTGILPDFLDGLQNSSLLMFWMDFLKKVPAKILILLLKRLQACHVKRL